MNHNKGIHHTTVLAGDPQRNADFYVKTLGLRLVKKSVNQDDPGTYHLFYGNQSATPGSSITFFPWPRAVQGQTGTGEAVTVSFLVPTSSQNYWQNRLYERNIDTGDIFERFGLTVLSFEDPDGLKLKLVFEDVEDAPESTREGNVPDEHAIRGFWGTTLKLTEAESTAKILTEVLGFSEAGDEKGLLRYTTDAPIGGSVLLDVSEPEQGKSGRGTVHHVAFRAKGKEELNELRWQVAKLGLTPTEIIDRHWFKSVYFRTPAGVLFEMATEGPGYTVDEDPDHLGEKLVLPPWMESKREQIENNLPVIKI